jgi:hypothetical protein
MAANVPYFVHIEWNADCKKRCRIQVHGNGAAPSKRREPVSVPDSIGPLFGRLEE